MEPGLLEWVSQRFERCAGRPPRPHQAEAVARLCQDYHLRRVGAGGAGKNYLLQHATGSGKSLTIAALADALLNAPVRKFANSKNQLSEGRRNVPLVDLVLIVNDRLLLDRQLGDTVQRFLEASGAEHTKQHSLLYRAQNVESLQKVLNMRLDDPERPAVVFTTLQKLTALWRRLGSMSLQRKTNTGTSDRIDACMEKEDEVHVLREGRIALIADEAHRSYGQGNKSTEQVNLLLQGNKMGSHNGGSFQPRHLVYIAFTATPSNKALEMFGVEQKNAASAQRWFFSAFHCYSMEQAVENGHVLDVLGNYRTASPDIILGSSCVSPTHIQKAAILEEASRSLNLIRAKARYVVRHLREHLETCEVNGFTESRGLMVCQSRAHVFHYVKVLRELLGTNQEVYGAFSGVISADGCTSISERDLNRSIVLEDARLLVVCSKYETGYDDPRLSILFVDRKLKGARAVQTLSRINRVAPGLGKRQQLLRVIDFMNPVPRIREAFEQFYGKTNSYTGARGEELRTEMLMDQSLTQILHTLAMCSRKLRVALPALTLNSLSKLSECVGPRICEDFEKDLESYVNMCQSTKREKVEFPVSFAQDLLRSLEKRWILEKKTSNNRNDCRIADVANVHTEIRETFSGRVILRLGNRSPTKTPFSRSVPIGHQHTAVTHENVTLEKAVEEAENVRRNNPLGYEEEARAKGAAEEIKAAIAEADKQSVLEILRRLDIGRSWSPSALSASGIGKVVNSLRKAPESSKELRDLALRLLRKWKKAFRKHKMDRMYIERDQKQGNSVTTQTRKKITNLLGEALGRHSSIYGDRTFCSDSLATNIEGEMFSVAKSKSDYISLARSLVTNIRSTESGNCVERLVCGTLTPKDLANMPSEDLAPTAVRQSRKRQREEMINLVRKAGRPRVSDETCPACGAKEMETVQARTGGSYAAERVQTLLHKCNVCGWTSKEAG